MPTANELVARFSEPEGFKKYIGFLGGKRARAAHALFSAAPAKGAAQSYTLDKREHDGTHYFVKAISTRGDLDQATLDELTRAAQLLPLGTVRYEGMMSPTLPDAMDSNPEAMDVHSLSRPDHGVLVYPVTTLSKSEGMTWALWAEDANGTYVYPLEDKKLR